MAGSTLTVTIRISYAHMKTHIHNLLTHTTITCKPVCNNIKHRRTPPARAPVWWAARLSFDARASRGRSVVVVGRSFCGCDSPLGPPWPEPYELGVWHLSGQEPIGASRASLPLVCHRLPFAVTACLMLEHHHLSSHALVGHGSLQYAAKFCCLSCFVAFCYV